ncbi:CueP family metal-binding protein [Demequina sp. NBRC 110056]|uniref:CueP family metal-binding protein n=1 Tax=Demequina sp. NBRC 110056 TaxID=1570345 RepID=UPI000A03F0F7|nr:CueP family metal-binding protein [Demequina sp. NBRC 110056]
MTISTLARRASIAAVAATAALVLAACSAEQPAPPDTADVLTSVGLDGLDAREIVDTLDATPLIERTTDYVVSIRPDELLVTDAAGDEASVPMPADEFYVSLAPYVEQTHDCYFHSLTTCTGELQNAAIDVTVVDNATGETVLDEQRTTFDNGFVGLWLPRDLDATITIGYDGLTATGPLSTSESDDATCVTTMQLA